MAAAFSVALGSWHFFGAPSAERNERQTIALAQRAEARASISAFTLERPGATDARRRAVGLYREGRRLADAGEYAEATDRFAEVFAILEAACPDCPTVMIRP